jgi:ATP-dependent DNA helicase RecG
VDVLSDKKSGKNADKTMRYWIRAGSVTGYATKDEISELFDKFNSVPYDDRVNRTATIDDISRGHLEDFLRKSNSSLATNLRTSTMENLLLSLEVANKTDTDLEIRNIGVLMFGDRPHKFIPGAQIDLVRFHTPDAEAADDFTEMAFTGPLFIQIRDAMNYLKTTVIEEKVVKIPKQMEAERFFNYPYGALEEILVNATFHKLYRQADPVEIRVYVDHIMILNYPGPAHWIDMEEFVVGKAKARSYRNRRIGEFLKEIDLSEKQCTGITKILRELKDNGSPPPEFKTDEGRHYMIVTIRIRDGFEAEEKKLAQKSERTLSELLEPKDYEKLLPVIKYIEANENIKPSEAESLLGKSSATVRRYLGILVDAQVLTKNGKANNTVYIRTKALTHLQ